MHLKYAEMLAIVVHENINSDQKLANYSPYFTALQDINILETQRSYKTTVNLENPKFYKNLSSGFKIIRLRWLDWIFLGGYLPSLSLNCVGMSKDMEKRLPQLYYTKMKISYDLGFIAIGVTMAT